MLLLSLSCKVCLLSAHRVSRTILSGEQTGVELLWIVLIAPHVVDVRITSRLFANVAETTTTLKEIPTSDDATPAISPAVPTKNGSTAISATP